MRVAFVHDNLWQLGGAERVLFALHDLFPEAPVYTIGASQDAIEHFPSGTVRTSFVQRIPRRAEALRKYVFLFPSAIRSLQLRGFDLVISSSWGFAKAVRLPATTLHLCYCHSPLNWAWRFGEYVCAERLPLGATWSYRAAAEWFRRWDARTARGVTQFVANSSFTAQQIRSCYGRDSVVAFPPVDLDFWRPTCPKKDYAVLFSRLVPHKRVDVAVSAFRDLAHQLYVVGDGRDRQRLEAMAPSNVSFLGRMSDDRLRDTVSAARVTVVPGIEDFGLAIAESLACGTPVVAFKAGGALDLIRDGENGTLVLSQEPDQFARECLRWLTCRPPVDEIRRHALCCALPQFRHRMREIIDNL